LTKLTAKSLPIKISKNP